VSPVVSIRLLILTLVVATVTAWPLAQDAAHAQGRHAVRRVGPPRGGPVVVAAYYRPLVLSPFYNPFYDPWWYPYAWYPPYGYGYAEDTASVRVQVSPRETEVFVDGYYAGTVDEFDGVFQRLRLESGPHEVTLYLAGHRTMRQSIFLQDGGTFRIRHTMEPLAPGETGEPRPAAPPRPVPERRGPTADNPRQPRPDDVVRGDRTFGAIAIRVQPADAEVLIDGEPWEGPQDNEALVVQLAPGTHRIEVRKAGYRSYAADLTVTAAETTPVNISLPKE
jgi:hypothetical protein